MAKEEVEVKEFEYADVLYGYSGGVKTCTPSVFSTMGIPEEHWFTVDIKPMSDADCASLRAINAKVGVDIALNRCGERGDKITAIKKKIKSGLKKNEKATLGDILDISELAFWQFNMNYEASFDDVAAKMDLVYPYLSNLQNHKEPELTKAIWASMPNNIREDIYNEVVRISNVSVGESINLL